MRVLLWLGAGGALILMALLAFDVLPGAREPVDLSHRPVQVPPIAALDGWLAEREAEVPELRPDAAKTIVWAGAPGQKTALSVVYVHGFSAAAPELRPVPDQFAAGLGANLFFTRLSGHGRDGAAMARAARRRLGR